jgi:hypothetical protein
LAKLNNNHQTLFLKGPDTVKENQPYKAGDLLKEAQFK